MPKKPRRSAKVKSKSNTGIVNDDDLRALALNNHKPAYERSLAAKKKADAAFKNACKLIKAELGPTGVTIIKAMVELDTPEGEAAVTDRIRAQATAAKWAGLPIGAQIELQLGEPDRTPAVDRARDEGKKASMENKPRKSGYAAETPQHAAWMDGYNEHQGTLAAKLGTGNGDKKDPRPRHLRERDAEQAVEDAAKH